MILVSWNINGLRSYQKKFDLKEFIDTYEEVVDNYYGEINKDELINSAIDGMLSELDDPYSMYMKHHYFMGG